MIQMHVLARVTHLRFSHWKQVVILQKSHNNQKVIKTCTTFKKALKMQKGLVLKMNSNCWFLHTVKRLS